MSNAGIAKKKAFVALTDEEWRRTIDVNLGGAMHCARAVAPQMIARGSGRIISLSSLMGGWWGWSEHVHYNAAKAGIEGLTRGLAMELGPHGVTVNAVAPGFVRTAQSLSVEHSLGPEGLELAVPFVPLRRIGDPDDIAEVVLFLASDASRYMTGQTLLVDGGVTLGDLGSAYCPIRLAPGACRHAKQATHKRGYRRAFATATLAVNRYATSSRHTSSISWSSPEVYGQIGYP